MTLFLTTAQGALVGSITCHGHLSAAGLDSSVNPTQRMAHHNSNIYSPYYYSTSSWKVMWWAAYQSFQRFALARLPATILSQPWSIQHDKALNCMLKILLCLQMLWMSFAVLPTVWETGRHKKPSCTREVSAHELASQLDSLHGVFLKEQAVLLRFSGSGARRTTTQSQASRTNASL